MNYDSQVLAQGVDPFTQGGQAGAEGGEERSFHLHSITTVLGLTASLKYLP